jgi:hypothetical protein
MRQTFPLDDRLDRVAQHVIRARLFLDLWFYFEGANTRPQIIETMRDYNEFFRLAPHAYLAAYVIYIAGVFDTRRGTISLAHLVPEVWGAGQLKVQDAADIDALMAKAEPIADKVRTLRHRAFAHKDAHISYNEVFTLAAVKPLQLRSISANQASACQAANGIGINMGLRLAWFAMALSNSS